MSRRVFWIFFILSFICILWSCAPEKPLGEIARKFRKQVVGDLGRLSLLLAPALQNTDARTAADGSIAEFFQSVSTTGRSGCIVAVLDPNMHYIAGRILNPDEPAGEVLDVELSEYEYLKSAFKGLERGQIVQNTLHYRQQKIYVIAAPVRNSVRTLGFVFIAFPSECFKTAWPMSEEEFKRIDFNNA
jgi:hypothetical protein